MAAHFRFICSIYFEKLFCSIITLFTFSFIHPCIAGIVEKAADLDVASVMAMGFPPPRGGLIFWGDLVGAGHIVQRLNEWAVQFDSVGLGGFFKPCAYLERAAREGRKLEAGVDAPAKL